MYQYNNLCMLSTHSHDNAGIDNPPRLGWDERAEHSWEIAGVIGSCWNETSAIASCHSRPWTLSK